MATEEGFYDKDLAEKLYYKVLYAIKHGDDGNHISMYDTGRIPEWIFLYGHSIDSDESVLEVHHFGFALVQLLFLKATSMSTYFS